MEEGERRGARELREGSMAAAEGTVSRMYRMSSER